MDAGVNAGRVWEGAYGITSRGDSKVRWCRGSNYNKGGGKKKMKENRGSFRTTSLKEAPRSFLRQSAGNRVFSRRQNIPKYPNASASRRAEQEEASHKPYTAPFANSSGLTCRSSDASRHRDRE